MEWSAIDFSSNWAIFRSESIVGYRPRVFFPEPLDLSKAVAFRRICPEMMEMSLPEVKAQCVGLTEFALADVDRKDKKLLEERMKAHGFDLRLEPILRVEENPFCTLGRGFVLMFTDEEVERELLACLDDASAPRISPERDLDSRWFPGNRDRVIQQILKLFESQPKTKNGKKPPPPKLPPFKEQDPPRFRYIDESILRHYVDQQACHGCDQYAHVFWLLRDLIIDGEEIDAESVCYDCLRRHEITDVDAEQTKNAIAALVNAHYPKGSLSGEDRKRRVEQIYREFMATPKLPNFIQNVDWPTCCGDFTIFTGDAGVTNQGPFDGYAWWGHENDGALEYGIEGMMGGEDRVSLFHCPRCDANYWTFQYT